MKNKKLFWKLSVASVILIILITYSPLVIPSGKYQPTVFHLPYSLWLSILLTILLVIMTYLGGKAIPDKEEDTI